MTESSSDHIQFCRQLKELRKAKGFSQESLALEAGIDQTMVSKAERLGPTAVSIGTIIRLRDILERKP